MKLTGILLIVGILFLYIPILPKDDCQEANHARNMKMDCGYIFHCPFLSNVGVSESMTLPYFGQAISISLLPVVDELPDPIFRPPKKEMPHS